MCDREEKSELNEENTEGNSDVNRAMSPLARRGVLALLGAGGLGIVGSQSVSARPQRPWRQDIDAQEHTLSNLGSLKMASNSTEITDFAGENLSIEGGILNATGNPSFVETDEIIHLSTIHVDNHKNISTAPHSGTSEDIYVVNNRLNCTISTNKWSFSNITNTFLSLSGYARADDGERISVRLYDRTTGNPIPDSEVEVETEGGYDELGETSYTPFDGPKAEYKTEGPHLFQVQTKTSLLDYREIRPSVGGITIHLWGEI